MRWLRASQAQNRCGAAKLRTAKQPQTTQCKTAQSKSRTLKKTEQRISNRATQSKIPRCLAKHSEILRPGNSAGGFAHYEFGGQQPVQGWGFAFLDGRVDGVQNDAHGGVAQGFHRLGGGGGGGGGKGGGGGAGHT